VAKNYSSLDIIFQFLKGDNHPPLFYLMLRFWGLIFGFSDFYLRLLPILFGSLTIFVTYLFVRKLINWQTAIIVSLLLATSPLHVYYSQELRMYPVVTFWTIMLLYVYLFLMKSRAAFWKWSLFAIMLVGLIATDYIGIFLLPIFIIFSLIEKRNRIKVGMSFLPLMVVFIWWMPILFSQRETIFQQLVVLPGWGSIIGGATIKDVSLLWLKFVLGRISFYPKTFYYLLVGIFSLPVLICLYQSLNRKVWWLWGYLLIPLVGSFISSIIVPSFSYSRLIFVLPAFYGLIGYGLMKFSRKIRVIMIGLVLLGNLIGLGFYYIDINNQREQWKQSVSYIESLQPDLVIFEFPESFASYTWYSQNTVKAIGGLTQLYSVSEKTTAKIEGEIDDSTRRIIYVSYLRDLTDPEMHIQKILENKGYKNAFSKSYVGVGEVVLYAK
jgi:4-amino-4-deoxy-L-arabinose transferase-like glycosyltransferase